MNTRVMKQATERRDRQVMTPADFTAEDAEALENTRAPPETAEFNHEVTDTKSLNRVALVKPS
jgi:hypothetical protein